MPIIHRAADSPQYIAPIPPYGRARLAWLDALEQAVEADAYQRLTREREHGASDELAAQVLHGLRQDLHLRVDLACDAGQARHEIDRIVAGAA